LQNVTVEFPLGVLCVVTGVSGSGKSTLVEDTLYPALCRRLRKEAPKPYDFDDVFGDGQINDVAISASMWKAGGAAPARATAISRSTCSSWPTYT
jgi:excinuclease UvrABC ATPase subunit